MSVVVWKKLILRSASLLAIAAFTLAAVSCGKKNSKNPAPIPTNSSAQGQNTRDPRFQNQNQQLDSMGENDPESQLARILTPEDQEQILGAWSVEIEFRLRKGIPHPFRPNEKTRGGERIINRVELSLESQNLNFTNLNGEAEQDERVFAFIDGPDLTPNGERVMRQLRPANLKVHPETGAKGYILETYPIRFDNISGTKLYSLQLIAVIQGGLLDPSQSLVRIKDCTPFNGPACAKEASTSEIRVIPGTLTHRKR